MIVVAFKKPDPPSPDWIRPNASARCSGLSSLIGRPLRPRGMKCQLSRSGESYGYVALAACACDSDSTNRSAATAMRLPGRLDLGAGPEGQPDNGHRRQQQARLDPSHRLGSSCGQPEYLNSFHLRSKSGSQAPRSPT